MAKDVSQLIKEATEAVKNVPENLREIAFSKAFDALFSEEQGEDVTTTARARGRRAAKKTSAHSSDAPDKPSLDQLDRTAHPEITHDGTALGNSLRVLLAAREDLGIDGLSASEIAHVLLDKFRCRMTRQAVSQALNHAGRYVNRHKEGNAVIFRLMGSGEQYLATLNGADDDNQVESKPQKKRKQFGKGKANSKKQGEPTGANAKKKAGGRSPGPMTALRQLQKDGFFSKPRSIADIIGHLKDAVGRTYKATDMSPTLLRLLREKSLARTKNADSQYEYKNA